MASRWNQQEQGAKRRRSNQGTRGSTQPAASNPNKNRKSTDTNRNSGRTVAAKPAPKAAPKQNKPKQNKPSGVQKVQQRVTYFTNKNKPKQNTQQTALNRLARQKGTAQVLTGKQTPLPPKRATRMGQTLNPMEQLKTDAKLGRENWISRATVPAKPLTAEQQKKKNQQTAKQSGFNARARKQTLSSYDQKLSQGKQFQIQQAKQRFDEAKAKGDSAGMAKAHREAESLRYGSGYSGGASGNEYITGKLSQDDYNRLNADGQKAMKQARLTRSRAVTEEEIARADRRIEEILNAPGYRNNRLSEAETGKGWTYGPDGRRMWAGTKEQNRADAAQGLAALRAVGEGAAGGLLYAGQTASRATRDKFERENIDKWIADEANYNQAKSRLEFIQDYKRQFGVVPDGYNEMQAQIEYNNAVQARAQLARIQHDPDSLYYDETHANTMRELMRDRYSLPGRDGFESPVSMMLNDTPTTREETLGERLLRQAAEDQAKATEGMNGVERFVTNALISTGQSVPGMALGLIPGVGPALGLGVLGAQAGGSRAYDLRQQGVTAEDAYRAGFISGGIEALTEKLPLENFAQIVKGKGGKSALRNVLEQAGLEGSEEAVSYVGNYIADVAQQNPDAHFSWLELLENAGMGAIGGAAFGVAGGILSPGHAVSPMGAQSEEIQEQARGAAAQVEAVQDAETQIRTAVAQRLREDAQAYNEMVKAGVWSDAEQEMVKESLDQRYAEIAGQNAGQTSPVANQAPLTQVFEEGMQRNRARAERVPAASVPTPLTVNETPVSVNPVEQAERMTAEALRATDAEMARRDAVAQLQAETPPITYERSGLPPTSFLGAAIDARREARARAEAEAQVRRDQEIARQNRVAAETAPNAVPTVSQISPNAETGQQARQPVSRLEGLASTFGESGAASLRTIGGKMVTGQGAFVRDFTDVYNQVLGGRSESQVNRPAGMSDANYFAAVTAAQNDRQTGWDLDILKASKAAGRNVNAGVDWRDQYVRQMDRKTARTVDGLAKALGVKVVFAEKGSILTAGGTAANAEITGNVVRIEKDNPNPVRMLIGHELTHRMQDVSPESYRAFRDYAMSVPGSMEALERTVSLYQRAGAFRAQDNARQMAMDEVTADFAGSLLENSDQLQEFIRRNYENRTMLEVIRDFFRDLAAKLTGRERAQADEAVRLLEEAIKGASERVKETEKAEKGNKNTAREGGVKKLFSLSAPVEETDTLIAMHNLTADKMGKALDLGGFPMPSIAVTRKDIPHTNFGDISLVMSRDTIDPKKSRKNTVYSADAWTPTFPSIEYEADSKVENRIYRELTRLLDGVDSNASGSAWQYASNLGDMLNRHGGAEGLIDAAANSLGMQAAYVRSKGVDIPGPETKETVTRMEPGFIDLYDTIINTLGEEAVRNIRKPDSFLGTGSAWRKQWQAENGEKLKAALKAHNRKRAPGLSEEQLEADINGMSLLTMHTLVRDASDYLRNGPEKRSTTTDYSKMQETIRDAVDQEGFRAWLEDLYDGVVKDSGVYNNKDLYTPSGNRRTFKQTHVPATLDNIAKVMASQNGGSTKNVSGFHGIKTLRAGTAKRFKSIKEMHGMEDRLQHLTPEEAKQISDALSDRMVDIMNRISGEDSGDFFSHMTRLDAIGETLMEVAESENYTIDNIVKTFGQYQYKVGNGLAQEIKELLFDVSQMPVNIFEAKPERAVRFDEVLAAVVPSDMDAGLRSRMEEAGMRLIDYERDNEQSRMDAVNSVEGARFSITPQADADYMAAVESGDMETAQRMVDEAAKAAGYTIKAYHGTPKRFNEFSKYRIGSTTDYGWFGRGFYFTTEKDIADVYAGYLPDSNVIEAYLKVRNPFVFTEYPGGEDMSPGEIMEDVLGTKYGRRGELTEDDKAQRSEDFTEWLAANGYDGVEIWSQIMILESEQAKRTDPVTYDDDGNVIPLSERFNAETGDIRYSIGTEGYDRARLMRENQELKEKLEFWRGQVKKSDRTKADPKEVRKLANSLRTDYSTEMDAGEITQRLQAIYDGIGKDWSYDRAYEEAGKLARDMIEQATATEDYLYAEYEPMRKFFQDTPLVVTKEMQRAIPDYNEWRKPLFGKLRLKGGEQTNVDQVFQEAVERWPEFFNEEVSSHSLDQLDRIVEVLDNVYRRDEINPFEDDMSAPAGYLATAIMDMYWDIPAVKKTFADRAEARLARQIEKTNQAKEQGRERVQAEREKGNARVRAERERGAQRVQAVREQRDRTIAKLRADHKEKYEKALQRARERREKALKKQSERYLTAKKKRSQQQKERELRAKIVRHVNKLSTKLTRPTDTQHIPEALVDTVRTALESINLASKDMKDTKRTQAFAALQKMYQEMETNGSEVVIDPDLIPNISDIIGFADTPIANLGMEDLNTIWQTVRAIEASISTFNKALGRAKFETISQPAFGIRDYLTGREDRGDYRGPFRQMDKLLNFNMLTPEAYFLRMGNSGKEVFRMLRDAQDRHITIMDQAQRKTREIVGKTDIKKLEKEKHTFTFDGQTVELTTAQIMSLYELMKRQQAVDHVMIGGIRPESVKKGIKDLPPARPWHLTQDQVSEVVDSLTPEQVKLADELQKYMGGTMAELGNEASMEVYGYRKFTEKHYFPISVDKNQTQSDVKNDAVSGTIAGWGSARPVKPNANNAVILRSIFDVYADHTTEMANYASWLAPMENMNRIFNFRYKDEEGNQTGTMKDQLETLFGKNGEAYWKQLQNDLNNGVHGRDDSPFSAFMGTYKASAIGANIRVIAQQPTAILRALDSINPADFVAGMARARWGKFDNIVKQYAPIAIWKDWGYFQQDTGRQMRNVLFNDDTKLQKANSAMMWGAGKADSLSWTAIWNALESETRRKRKDLDPKSKAFYEAVAERFNEVVDHTQVVDGILQRSQIMRSADGLTKMATSFMAEPTKTYNMMLSAIYEARNAKGRERSAAMGKLAKTAFALTVSITVNAVAQSLVDAIRDDDKDEDYWKKFIQAYFGLEGDTRKEQIKNGILNGNLEAAFNPLTYIPYLKDIVSQTQGYSVSRMDMDTISRVLKAFTNVEKAMSGEGKNTKQSAWLNLTAEIARFLGVPAANIKRDVQTILRTFFAGTGNYRMLYEQEKFLYDVTSKNTLTEFSKLILGAERAGDDEAAQAIWQDMIDSGVDAEKIDKKLAELRKKAVTDTEEFQTALAQKTDAYQTMLEADARFNGLDEDKQENVRKRLNDYAQYQVLGQSMDVENDKMEKIADAESHKVPAADWVVFTAAADAIEADYKPDGTLIQGSKKKKVVVLIDSYDIPNEGKSYMYLSQGYSEKDNPYQ